MELSFFSNPLSRKTFERMLRYTLAIFAAHYIVVNGTDQNIISLLLEPAYYEEMGFSLVVSIAIVKWIHYISIRLDEKYGWDKHWPNRIFFQIGLGFLVPALFELFMVAAYFKLLANVNILKTRFIKNEYRIVLIMILFFNLYCIARFFYRQWRKLQRELNEIKIDTAVQPGLQQSIAMPLSESVVVEQPKREIFIVQSTLRTIPVKMEDICSFYRANGCYYVRTYDQTVNEAFIISQTLKEVEELIDGNLFFRINRKMIVSFKSCDSYRSGNGKMLELIVKPPHVDQDDGVKELKFVTVSEDRVHAFKTWMSR